MEDELAFLDGPDGTAFNPTQQAESASDGEYKPIPPGKYPTRIIEATVKPTNAEDGKYINLRLDVAGNDHNGRVLWDMIIVQKDDAKWGPDGAPLNKAAKAVDIGKAKFGALCVAAGFPERRPHLKELIGKVVSSKVKIEGARTDANTGRKYDAQNRVTTYEPYKHADKLPVATNNYDDDEIPF